MEAKHTEDIEEALQDMTGLNQTIFDNSFDLIILMNDAGKIISWNKGANFYFTVPLC